MSNYLNSVKTVLGSDLLLYAPLDPQHTSGGTTLLDVSGNGYNGTNGGTTLAAAVGPDGRRAPLSAGSNYINFYSAGLGTNFSFDLGSIMMWIKITTAGVWTDGVQRKPLRFLRDGDNQIAIQKVANNQLRFTRKAGGVTIDTSINGLTTVNWVCCIATWDQAADIQTFNLFHDNIIESNSTAGLSAATGSGLSAANTCIFAQNTSGDTPHHCCIAHFVIGKKVLIMPQMLALRKGI